MGGYFSYLMRRAGVSEGEESLFCFFPKSKYGKRVLGVSFHQLLTYSYYPSLFSLFRLFMAWLHTFSFHKQITGKCNGKACVA